MSDLEPLLLLSDEAVPDDPLARALAQRQTLAGIIFAAMAMPRSLAALPRSVPLTIIGGFLGAGKTTLLNQLLADPKGRKLIVLVNDFGKINIDAELIAEQTDDAITLTNGCACCAVSSDLSQSLIEIAQRSERPDALVLETSGVADPGSIAQIALANTSIRLDGIITVVDAETLSDRASDPATSRLFHDQISSADLVLLTKLDLLAESQSEAARHWLTANFAAKPIVEASHGQVPIDLALGIKAEHEPADPTSQPRGRPADGHGFESYSIEVEQPLDEALVKRFLADLPDQILRAKGFVSLAQHSGRRSIYQRVGRRWTLSEDTSSGDSPPCTSLVFIGPSGTFDRERFRTELEACVK